MRILVLLSAMFAALLAAPANATVIAVDNLNYSPGAHYGTLHLGTDTYSGEPAGRFKVEGHDVDTGALFSAYSFCVDIFKLADEGNFRIGALSELTSNVVKQSQLAALVTNAQGLIDSLTGVAQEQAAASFQLAIWEVIYETTSSGYNVASGNFFADDTNFTALHSQVNSYLANVESGTWSASPVQASLLLHDTGALQAQIIVTPSAPAVPEPATWMMMILGFGLVGSAMRNAKKGMLQSA